MNKFNKDLQTQTNNILEKLNIFDKDKRFSVYAREKFNEIGLSGNKTKLEDVMYEIYNVAMSSNVDAEVKIKAIKTMCEMVGGGLNEKQVSNTNVQINLGDVLDKLK